MHEAAAEETEELLEVQEEEAAAEEAAAEEASEEEPETPETVIGLVHQTGQHEAEISQLNGRLDALASTLAAMKAEMAGIARVEAEHLLDTILEEAESGEAAEEAQEHRPAAPSWWERILGG